MMRPATKPEYITRLKTRLPMGVNGGNNVYIGAERAIKAYNNGGMKIAEPSCNRCDNEQQICLIIFDDDFGKCVLCTSNIKLRREDCNAILYVLKKSLLLILTLISTTVQRDRYSPAMGKALSHFKRL